MNRDMSRGERIAYAIRESGNSPAAMSRLIGCTSAAIYQWIKGETKDIKNEFLFGLADATGFEARWIAIGEGPQRLDVNEAQRRLLALFSKLDERGQATVLRAAQEQCEYVIDRPIGGPKP
jgi:transcriptional regulator with XRE-family HTH domain